VVIFLLRTLGFPTQSISGFYVILNVITDYITKVIKRLGILMNAKHVACEVKNIVSVFSSDEYIKGSLQSLTSVLISVCLIFSPSLLLYFLCVFFSLLSFF
jgi:hypothetical protein